MNWVKTTESGGSSGSLEDASSTASSEREIEALKHHPFYSSLDNEGGSSNKKFNVSCIKNFA